MTYGNNYKAVNPLTGLTRVDMLLTLYDRAVGHLELARDAAQAGLRMRQLEQQFHAQKMILGLHAGLKPEQSEVAFNVARLLHYVSDRLVAADYSPAIQILSDLRQGFHQIRDEAIRLENSGVIPSLDAGSGVEVVA